MCVSLSLSTFFFFLVWWVRLVRYLFHSCSERRRESGGDFLRDSSISKDFLTLFQKKLLQKFQGFFNSRISGTFSISLQCKSQGFYHSRISKAHTYILSIKFAQFFYFLWISVVTMEESGVPLLDCIYIGGTAVFQSCPVFFYFCVAV